MKKTFVLDTNVLIHDPRAFLHFDDNHVIIPLKVIEEIDAFKRELSERGRNARQVARALDELRDRGRLAEGIALEGGGTLRVAFPVKDASPLAHGTNDDQILSIAVDLHRKDGENSVFLVSKDINLRIKADAYGVSAEDYENGHIDTSEIYTGYSRIALSPEALQAFGADGKVPPPEGLELRCNEYVILDDAGGSGRYELGRYDLESKHIVALQPQGYQHLPLQPRNDEQRFAIDALLNDDIKLVTLSGKAGTGKTLLAVAMGVFKTIDEKHYDKLLVSRPTLPMGKDIGFLPGNIEEKLDPWMQPIYDALDLLKSGRFGTGRRAVESLTASERIAVEPLTYIRGRSIPNQFMIIDEAQNLTPLEVKTVITRVGHGTKIVLTGDIYQIDHPYVDILSNGLNAVADRFMPYPIAAHIMLKDGVRSKIAELAANIL